MLNSFCDKIAVALSLGVLLSPICVAESPDDLSRLTIDRIYDSKEFSEKSFSGRWLALNDDNAPASYTTLEESAEYPGRHDIVRHDAAGGETTVMVSAAQLIPAGQDSPLEVESYSWSHNHNLLLVYTNSKRVWRQNTRGDYWILDRSARQLTRIGGDAPPSSLMFAKISPDGKKVGYVHERNLYAQDLLGQNIRQLTNSPSDDVINGTTDWVYEEEFGLRDGFRWSPDSKSIAYWQIDTTGVKRFPLVNNTDTLYPTVTWFAYPKVGQRNPSCRVGLCQLATSATTWIQLPGDSREHYVPRINFVDATDKLLIQQLNRLQNTNRLFVHSQGSTNEILIERDDAWVDVHDETFWLDGGRQFTWPSDRDGWRHVYLAPTRGESEPTQITHGDFDVVQALHMDQSRRQLYFIASPDNATQRHLFRSDLAGKESKRLTPKKYAGGNRYDISPDGNWAIHKWSSANHPTVTQLISLPDHKQVRVLEDNQELLDKLDALDHAATEFFRVDIGDGVQLDGWCIKPPKVDKNKKYPLLIYVYGEPAGSTVQDRWGGTSYLWHLMMAQHGYVVMSFDNRGTKAPRGREWRKSIYKKIGILPPKDQAAAVRAVLNQRRYLDKDKVAIWGWSGGGSSSLQALFKYPDLYHTGMAIAPVPNQRYYDTIYQERYMAVPSLNAEGFRLGSPINFAQNLAGNLLLVHGTADDNCHYATTEMLIDELIAHNKQFTMFAYPNRTHAVRERKNTTRHLRSMMTQFLLDKMPPNQSLDNEK